MGQYYYYLNEVFMSLKKVCILGGKRIPFTKSFTNYSKLTNQDMQTFVLRKIVENFKLENKHLGEVAMGAVMKHSSDWNMARESVLGSGLNPSTPAYDIQRACGTGLESVINVANKISLGQVDAGIGGGSDTNSDAPIVLSRDAGRKIIKLSQSRTTKDKLLALSEFRPGDIIPIAPQVVEPRTGLTMGQHCEKMVQEWNVSQKEQDQLAYESHQKAAKAYESGFYKDLVCEYQGLKQDSILRASTTLEKLNKLRPAFDKSGKGSLTAGNSTPLTDGAAACFLASEEYAQENGHTPLAYFKDAQSWSVDFVGGAGLLMAPTIAVGKLLQRNNLSLSDFDFYEIHEAFAGQVLCTLKAWEDENFCKNQIGLDGALGSIDRNKMNVKGGSVALGHPFAATGARIVATLAKMLNEKGSGRGLISICTAGGMGVTAILEK